MQHFTIASVFVVATVTLLYAPQSASGVCCGGPLHFLTTWISDVGYAGANLGFRQQLCNDCTRPKPYCGVGSCNIFGCNCDGGCLQGECARRKRSIDGVESAEVEPDANSIVDTGDRNGDGELSMREAQLLLRKSGVNAQMNDLRQMDVDRNGKLSPEEIDVDARP